MKFSTVAMTETGYQIYPGATFEMSSPGADRQTWLLPVREYADRYGHEVAPLASSIRITDDLLISQDALIRPYVRYSTEGRYACSRWEVTLMRAAIRVGDIPVLVPESEAARCEMNVPAHAVLLAAPARRGQFELIAPINGRIFMSRLAVLTEGDEVTVNLVERGTKEGTIFKEGQPYSKTVESFQVLFDGTNVRLNGVSTGQLGQLCFS